MGEAESSSDQVGDDQTGSEGVINQEALKDYLYKNRVESPPGGNIYFVPRHVFTSKEFSQKNVEAVLRKQGRSVARGLKHYAGKIITLRKKLFTILLLGNFSQADVKNSISEFVDKQVRDDELPFVPCNTLGQNLVICNIDHGGVRMHACVAQIMKNWPQRDIDEFYRLQWAVQAVVFRKRDGVDGTIPHYGLDDNAILPCTENFKDDPSRVHRGKCSLVWPVRIAEDHQDLYLSPDPEVSLCLSNS